MKHLFWSKMLLLCLGLSASMVYADDSTTFNIQLNSAKDRAAVLQSVDSSGGVAIAQPSSILLSFTFNNVYGSGSVPKGQQTQTGHVNVVSGSSIVCTLSWTHEFYKDSGGTHDRFSTSVTSGSDVCGVTPGEVDGHHDNSFQHSTNTVSYGYIGGSFQ